MDAIDNAGVPDIYADDIETVEVVGPNVRVIFFTWQGPPGNRQKVVVAKIVRPIEQAGKGKLGRLVCERIAQTIAANEAGAPNVH